MKRTTWRLNMIFELLASWVSRVTISHSRCPNTSCHSPHHRVLRVHAVRKEEWQIRRKIVNIHASGQISLHKGKTVRQCKGQLRNRISPCFCNMVSRDWDWIEISNGLIDKILLHITHHTQTKLGRKNTSVLPLIFLKNIGLYRPSHSAQSISAQPLIFVIIGLTLMLTSKLIHLLVNGGIKKHSQHCWCRTIYCHRHRCPRVTEIKPIIECLHVIQGTDRNPRIAHFSINIRTLTWIPPIECDWVKGGRQSFRFTVFRKSFKSPISFKRIPLTSEHSSWVFSLTLKWENARRVRKFTRKIIQHQPC